jgi:hypothetical protein
VWLAWCDVAWRVMAWRGCAAVALLRRALEIESKLAGAESEATLFCNDLLARALSEAGEGAELVPTLRRSLDIKRALVRTTPDALARANA